MTIQNRVKRSLSNTQMNGAELKLQVRKKRSLMTIQNRVKNTKRMLPVWLQVQKKRSLMTTQNCVKRSLFTTQMNTVEL